MNERNSDDTRRHILAFALCAGVLVVWSFLFAPAQQGASGPAGPVETPAPPAVPTPPPAPAVEAPVAPVAAVAPVAPPPPEETYVLASPRMRAEFTNKGASLRRLWLTSYRAAGGDGDLLLLDEFDPGARSLTIHDRTRGTTGADLREVTWHVDRERTDAARGRIAFYHVRGDGITFRKRIEIQGDHLLGGAVTVENAGARPVELNLDVRAAAGVAAERLPGEPPNLHYMTGVAGRQSGARVNLEGSMKFVPTSVAAEPGEITPDGVRWAGTADKYFAAVLTFDGWDEWLRAVAFEPIRDGALAEAERARIESPGGRALTPEESAEVSQKAAASVAAVAQLRLVVPGQGLRELAWSFYAGPKDPVALRVRPEAGLEALMDYGFWSYLFVKLSLFFLQLFHALTGNYGVAIILLTIVVRLCLFPISRKSQVAMFRMQKLQPELNLIKERYKNDKQRQAAEQMKLFKQHKASPFGGCLPLLLQIPVFIGLYTALERAIELRQSPFILWIHDLSQPDRLCPLPFSILGQAHLNLLPILMLVPMIVQTALAPKPADEMAAQQQKMMMWMMPGMFLFMCYTMPSGVSLYWLVSSLWGLGEYRLIKKVWLK